MQTFNIPEKIELIIFDIDNTLYRNAAYVRIQNELLIKRFAEERLLSLEEARSEIEKARSADAAGRGLKTTSMGNAMAALGIPFETNARWRSELFHPEDYLIPDIALQDTLRTLSEDYVLVAATNNSREIGERTLKTLGILNHFIDIAGLDTLGKSKPSPALFSWALSRVGVDAGRSISVGDRYDVDISPAVALGLGGVLVESMEDVYSLPVLFGTGATTG